jgi:hypothetical protein
MFIDARLPVRFGPVRDRTADDAVLTDAGEVPAPPSVAFRSSAAGHTVDCACCSPRSEAALALAGLFRDRAMGACQPFRRVLAVVGPEGEAAVRAALESDPVASGRFRLA